MDADAVAEGILFDEYDPWGPAMSAPAPTLAPSGQAPRGRAEAPPPGPAEHPSYQAPAPQYDVYGPAMAPAPPRPGYQPAPYNAQAIGAMPEGKSRLGLILLALAGAAAVGAKMGGPAGAGAGALGAGAAVNAVRALSHFKRGTEAGDKEGRVSAVYALVGAAGAGLLWFKYVEPPSGTKRRPKLLANPEPDDDYGMAPERDTPCDIRPVGP